MKRKVDYIFLLLIFILIVALCSLYISYNKKPVIFGGSEFIDYYLEDHLCRNNDTSNDTSTTWTQCQEGPLNKKQQNNLDKNNNPNNTKIDNQNINNQNININQQETLEDIKKEIFINHNSKLMVDGHNLIHALSKKKHLTLLEFKNNLNQLSQILTDSLINYPNLSYNFVLKNPNINMDKKYETLHDLEKLAKPKSLDSLTKKVLKENSLYVGDLVTMSKLYPKIRYHLAYDKEKLKNTKHHTKGRDDLLTIYLSDGNYVISNDKFRDVNDFHEIPEFYHIEILNGKVLEREHINPKKFVDLKKPKKGSQLNYKFIEKNDPTNINIKSGDIYLINGIPTINLLMN